MKRMIAVIALALALTACSSDKTEPSVSTASVSESASAEASSSEASSSEASESSASQSAESSKPTASSSEEASASSSESSVSVETTAELGPYSFRVPESYEFSEDLSNQYRYYSQGTMFPFSVRFHYDTIKSLLCLPDEASLKQARQNMKGILDSAIQRLAMDPGISIAHSFDSELLGYPAMSFTLKDEKGAPIGYGVTLCDGTGFFSAILQYDSERSDGDAPKNPDVYKRELERFLAKVTRAEEKAPASEASESSAPEKTDVIYTLGDVKYSVPSTWLIDIDKQNHTITSTEEDHPVFLQISVFTPKELGLNSVDGLSDNDKLNAVGSILEGRVQAGSATMESPAPYDLSGYPGYRFALKLKSGSRTFPGYGLVAFAPNEVVLIVMANHSGNVFGIDDFDQFLSTVSIGE